MIEIPIIKSNFLEFEYIVSTYDKKPDEVIRATLEGSGNTLSRRRVLPFRSPPFYPQTQRDWDHFFLYSEANRRDTYEGFDGLVTIARHAGHFYNASSARDALYAISGVDILTDIVVSHKMLEELDGDMSVDTILQNPRRTIHTTELPNIVVGFTPNSVYKVYYPTYNSWALFARDMWNVYAIGVVDE